MTKKPTLDGFLAELQTRPVGPDVCRPWTDWKQGFDIGPEAPGIRLANLRSYLSARLKAAEVIMVAEAVGYQGGRFSGIAMTCERTLLGNKPRVPADAVFKGEKLRTSHVGAARSDSERSGGFNEPTATIVWSTMLELGIEPERFVLWNSFAYHPYKSGNPLSNRTPTDREVMEQAPLLDLFLGLFPGRPVIAIGETAKRRLAETGLINGRDGGLLAVRHPANGGATAFREGVRRIMKV